ncbi:SpoIIE family protein phosphatase [Isoptericola variabilis]|uniref:Putative PAS/PAC sensor protein n=1 Tax=Isoptericola variabilis (strain 225) TaxID=743718 RepID=F6FUX7_ISOV2|nr:SpoIIE family protein phosphatase [Isoptericola variabilis]AEG44317.1 putative PAS/PAC sensor protein [Isoptericola variabilis 225]TWH31095.1 stage II sporulation protein E [Isoptericola variabilis J7]
MSDAGRASSWGAAPAGLARLDADGRVLDVNATLLAWAGAGDVVGRPLSDLLTVGGRIYFETHVRPLLALQGRVEEVALELRAPQGRLPVLLSAATRDDGFDVALVTARERVRFERATLEARAEAERVAQRLRWVQDATAALARAAGLEAVRAALLGTVEAHPAVAAAALVPPGAADVPADGRLAVPVAGEAQDHGTLVVTLHGRPGDEPVDRDALETVARQGAVALDRALLHEQSVSVAHELQHAMLTQDLPVRDDVTVVAQYRPAVSGLEVGGDWYDAFALDDATVAVAVGDVVGHGLHAATAMGQLRTATRALARPGLGPAGLLRLVDEFVTRRDVGFAATLAYAELDAATGTLAYACAGHLPPLRVRADGTGEYLWDGRSAPLGVPSPRGPRTAGTVRLRPGEQVLLYTDGVVERRDRSLPDGLDRLAHLAGRVPAAELVAGLVDAEADRRDDACVLGLTWHPRPAPTPGPTPVRAPANRG